MLLRRAVPVRAVAVGAAPADGGDHRRARAGAGGAGRVRRDAAGHARLDSGSSPTTASGTGRLDFRGPAPTPYIDAATVRTLVQSAPAGQKAQLVELVERRLAEVRQLLPPNRRRSPARLSDERARLSEIGAAMAAMRAGVTIPLVASQRVVGFLCVLDNRVPEAFASDELAAMLDVGEQAAITIENCQLYEKMKERDRLAALGEMAAGLAHEIRNPLGAIKGAAQYLAPPSQPTAARRGVPRDHRGGSESPQRRGGAVPRLLAALPQRRLGVPATSTTT